MRPLVLITPDFDEDPSPRYRLDKTYADAVLACGGLPLIASFGSPIDELLAVAQGLIVTGGAFDIPPESYGEARAAACGPVKAERTDFERSILEAALAAGMPILGVCGGMQLLNVVRGGSLHQDIPAELPGALPHEQKTPKDEPSHEIAIEPSSLLAKAAEGWTGTPSVNSTHHQGVKAIGKGLRITARAPDGVVEAIEDPSLPFVVGVQWHPERLFGSQPWNANLFRLLIEAAAPGRRAASA